MKQNNFYLRWQKAAGAAKSEQRSRSIRTAAPGIAVVAAALLGWGAMTLYTASLTSQRQDIVNWCNDNSASFLASSQDAEAAAQFRSLTQYADGMTDLLDGYPAVTSSLLHRVEAAGLPSRSSSPATTPPRASCSSTPTPVRSSTFRPTFAHCRAAAFFRP